MWHATAGEIEVGLAVPCWISNPWIQEGILVLAATFLSIIERNHWAGSFNFGYYPNLGGLERGSESGGLFAARKCIDRCGRGQRENEGFSSSDSLADPSRGGFGAKSSGRNIHK